MRTIDAIAQILKKEGIEYLSAFSHDAHHRGGGGRRHSPYNLPTRACRRGHRRRLLARYERQTLRGVFAMQYGPGAENAYAGRRHRILGRRLKRGRPGPVMVEVPADVATAEVPDNIVDGYRPVKPAVAAGNPTDIQAAAQALLNAENPIIHAGQGVMYAGATDELVEFAELTQIPVMTTMAGKSAFPGKASARTWQRLRRDESRLLPVRKPRGCRLRHRHQLHAARHDDERAVWQDAHPRHERPDRHRQELFHRPSDSRRRQACAAAVHRTRAKTF